MLLQDYRTVRAGRNDQAADRTRVVRRQLAGQRQRRRKHRSEGESQQEADAEMAMRSMNIVAKQEMIVSRWRAPRVAPEDGFMARSIPHGVVY
jgi:hypothetical protein